MQSKASTVEQYLAQLPDDRRTAIEAVRAVILENLPKGVVEGMGYGMIGYAVPHSLYPKGYHCDPTKPLPFASLASQKGHMALYLMNLYMSEDEAWFRDEWAKSGKKLDMGKSCVRFKKLDDVDLDAVGKAIARTPVDALIARYEAALAAPRERPAKTTTTTKTAKPARKEPAPKKAPAKPAAPKKSAAKASPATKPRGAR